MSRFSRGYSEQSRLVNTEQVFVDIESRWGRVVRSKHFLPSILAGVVLVVMGAMLAVSFSVLPIFTPTSNSQQPLTLDSTFDRTLKPQYFYMQWSPSTSEDVYTYWDTTNGGCSLKRMDAAKVPDPSALTTLLDQAQLESMGVDCSADYTLSFDNRFIMFAVNETQVYRHSTVAQYVVYDTRVSPPTATPLNAPGTGLLQLAIWSPATYAVAMVYENDVWVTSVDGSVPLTRVSLDGETNAIQNGLADWIYEEEILETSVAMYWSPQGSSIAYIRFNITEVPTYSFPVYAEDAVYPQNYVYKYPKPGYPNPTVSLKVYTLASQTTNDMANIFPATGEFYIYQVKWANDNTVAVKTQPRIQTAEYLSTCAITSGACTLIRAQISEFGWATSTNFLTFVAGGAQYVDSIVIDGYMHLGLFDTATGDSVRNLTSGAWEVIETVAYSTATNTLFFMSSQVSATEKHLYSVSTQPEDAQPQVVRLTPAGEGYYSAEPSASGSYFVLNYQGPDVPTYSLINSAGAQMAQIVDNAALATALKGYMLPTRKFITLPNSVGDQLNAWVLYPPGFSESKKYPVLMYVYGGPGSQTVMKQFQAINFNCYVAGAMHAIVVSVDGRGTGYRGQTFMKQTYLNLGIKESDDQTFVGKYIANNWKYAMADSIHIWGWSYGGFMTLMSLTNDNHIFKSGMSVAPVTNWRYYDSAYTERYMSTPEANPNGYALTAPMLQRAANMQGQLLIVHGTGDDNVHFQNSADMVTALVNQEYQFKTMYYPDKAHALAGTHTQKQLYTMLANTLRANLY